MEEGRRTGGKDAMREKEGWRNEGKRGGSKEGRKEGRKEGGKELKMDRWEGGKKG